MSSITVQVPDIGDFADVGIIELLVAPGDHVSVGQSLVTVESDKASMEIPSTHAGIVQSLLVAVGDKVREGSALLLLDSGEAQSSAPASAAAPAAASTVAPAAQTAQADKPAAEVLVCVPDIGDFADVGVIEILVRPGDTVTADQGLITVESDKASMEVPGNVAGIVKALRVAIGDKVSQGSPILLLQPAGAVVAASAPQAAASAASSAPTAPVGPAVPPVVAVQGPVHASPLARREAREQGVALETVPPTGPNGRVTADDVRAAVSRPAVAPASAPVSAPASVTVAAPAFDLPPWPQVDHAKFGPIERKPLGRIQKISAANLTRNAMGIPTVTNHDDADITELEAFRVTINAELASTGTKLTMLTFLIKACVAALQKFPSFNSSLDGDALVFKKYYHIAFAADTPQGLVVPVLRDADQKGIVQIAKETAALAAKAREGKLSPSDMSGATFTISSLGGIGGRYFTPIINAPEVAILGVCRAQQAPVWNGAAFVPRLMLPLSLSWDHRVVDGALAARFLAHLQAILGDFRRVLL